MSTPTILLRESYRDHGKVKFRTLANLSELPPDAIAVLRRSLTGEQRAVANDAFEAIDSSHNGHVQAGLLWGELRSELLEFTLSPPAHGPPANSS